jgi:hypothetical protein
MPYLGLSLTALEPAAAWYFIFFVCRFFASRVKNDTQAIKMNHGR